MTTVNSFLRNLALNELNGIWLGEQAIVEGWSPENKEKVVSYMNQGLNQLGVKFNLNQKDLWVDTLPNVTHYYMRSKFARSNTTDTISYKYLNDGMEPFVDDLIKIVKVCNEVGDEIILNDPADSESMYTPQYDCLYIPYPEASKSYQIFYQAKLADIDHNNTEDQPLNLPPMLLEALSNFVAGKAFKSMGGQENIMTSETYMAKYNEVCLLTEINDMANQSQGYVNNKASDRGFV